MRASNKAGFLLILILILGSGALAQGKTYLQDALIIPMDTTYQDHGMLEAYGLVYDLLANDVPVDWAIAPGKSYGGVDFVASGEDIPSGLPVTDHAYRGGPFIVDSAYYGAALPLVQAWQVDHPDVAVQLSQQQCQPVLSNGVASPHQLFFLIHDDTPDARHVGYLWWGVREQHGTRTAVLFSRRRTADDSTSSLL